MIIWSGLGFLPIVFLVLFGLCFANHSGPVSDIRLACIFFLTGLASGALGWWFRQRQARHSLFFIPTLYWGPIFIAMGIYELIQAAVNH